VVRRDVLHSLICGVVGFSVGASGVKECWAASGAPWESSPVQTSPVLEKFRKLEQTEKDLLMYQSELADPNDKTTNQSVERLIPLLRLLDLLKGIATKAETLESEEGAAKLLAEVEAVANKLPAKAKRREGDVVNVPGLKLVFNTYSDNIFFSDPERSNIYLKGGATPTNNQSILYLARNDIISKLEDLVAELKFASKNRGNFKESDLKGCGGSLRSAVVYFVKELDGEDVKQALANMK